MNMKITHFFYFVLTGILLLSCEKDKNFPEPEKKDPPVIVPEIPKEPETPPVIPEEPEELTYKNYPFADGSTSASPLQRIVACKLLGLEYEWKKTHGQEQTYNISFDYYSVPGLNTRLKSNGTHGSFVNLIDKKADFIITARTASKEEKAYAMEKGITLLEKPIAFDAFVFIMNKDNPVDTLSTEQVQHIYTAKITNWKDVGGYDKKINPYIRNANSGSQELMEILVMKDLKMLHWAEFTHTSMIAPFHSLRRDPNGISYTVYYYKEMMLRDELVKHLAIDGVYPDKNTIKDKSYPYTTEVYAVIRADEPETSHAYKIYELLSTEEGKSIIEESGYVPN